MINLYFSTILSRHLPKPLFHDDDDDLFCLFLIPLSKNTVPVIEQCCKLETNLQCIIRQFNVDCEAGRTVSASLASATAEMATIAAVSARRI